jgi:hypothetical protein
MIRKFLALAALATACATQSGGWSNVNVKLLSLQPGARSASGLSPVADAKVTLQCPDKAPVELGKTADDGTLRTTADVDAPLDCNVAVQKEAFQSASFKVASLCTETGGGTCHTMNLTTVLAQQNGASMAGSK